MNPTFLSHVRINGNDDWLETSKYLDSMLLRQDLELEGYEVLEVIDMEDIKTW